MAYRWTLGGPQGVSGWGGALLYPRVGEGGMGRLLYPRLGVRLFYRKMGQHYWTPLPPSPSRGDEGIFKAREGGGGFILSCFVLSVCEEKGHYSVKKGSRFSRLQAG